MLYHTLIILTLLQPSIPCRLLIGKASCSTFKSDTTSPILWPGPPRDLNSEIFTYRNATNSEWNGIRFTWKPPADASIRSLQGFLINMLYLSRQYNGITQCHIIDLRSANLTSLRDTDLRYYINTVFTLEKLKLPGPAEYYIHMYSLPRPSVDHDQYAGFKFEMPTGPNCSQFAACNPNPCDNGGECYPDGLNFGCDCENTGFTGMFCSQPI